MADHIWLLADAHSGMLEAEADRATLAVHLTSAVQALQAQISALQGTIQQAQPQAAQQAPAAQQQPAGSAGAMPLAPSISSVSNMQQAALFWWELHTKCWD